MARYIVIEVTDNDVAENLIEATNQRTKQGDPFRVVGVFVKPGRTCACINARYANYREDKAKHGFSGGVSLGARFGWWVCTTCKKPRQATHQLRNQILPSETYEELNRVDGDWEFVVDSLSVGGIFKSHIDRPKKLRAKKRKKQK